MDCFVAHGAGCVAGMVARFNSRCATAGGVSCSQVVTLHLPHLMLGVATAALAVVAEVLVPAPVPVPVLAPVLTPAAVLVPVLAPVLTPAADLYPHVWRGRVRARCLAVALAYGALDRVTGTPCPRMRACRHAGLAPLHSLAAVDGGV